MFVKVQAGETCSAVNLMTVPRTLTLSACLTCVNNQSCACKRACFQIPGPGRLESQEDVRGYSSCSVSRAG